jgi:polyhydroxyalkanoate synthesis regulator phasin
MPQPKKTSGAAARKPAAAAKKPAAAAKPKRAAAKRTTTPAAKPTPAARKPAAARRSTTARRPAATPNGAGAAARKPAVAATPPSADDLSANLGALRERLVSSVTLTTERLQDAVDDTVRRGRITRKDAEDLLSTLVSAGRAQTEALIADLEQLLGRGSVVRVRATRQEAGDVVLRTVDRARRRAGVGRSFPILGYDELNATQVAKRLDALTPAQLRKVRDYERRNGARKSVLGAIDRKLG